MGHEHSVLDTDTRFKINPITRQIVNESNKKLTLIQGDHNSERFGFEIPRYIEKHDMSLCNVTEVHYFNADSQTKEVKKGIYTVEDLQVSPEDEEKVVFSWLISNNATTLSGALSFLVRFKCVDNDGAVTYAWNTGFHNEILVSAGSDADVTFEEEYVDVIEQWKASVLQMFEDEFTDWKSNTELELSNDLNRWKANTDKELTEWKANVDNEQATWKNQTETDLEGWKKEEETELQRLFGDYETYWQNQIAVERARIDQFTKLEEGSTTGDAELIDLRVGADAETYANAGEAVRTQLLNVYNVLNALRTDFTNLLPIWKENTKVLSLNGGTLETPETLDIRVVSNTNYGSYYVNRYVPSNCTKLMILQKVKIISGDFSNYPHVYCYDETDKTINGATRLFRDSLEINGFEYYVNCVELVAGTKSVGIGAYAMKENGVFEVDVSPVLFDISKFNNDTIEKLYNLLLTDVIEKYFEEWHGNAPYFAFYADKAEYAEKAYESNYAERSNRSQSCYLAETPARETVTEVTDWVSTVTKTENGYNILPKETWGGIGLVRDFVIGKKYLVIWKGSFADKVGFIKNSGSAWNGMSTKTIQVNDETYYYGYAEALEDDLLDRIIIHTRMETEASIFDVTITEIINAIEITEELVKAIINGVTLYIPELKEELHNVKERVTEVEGKAHNHTWKNKNVLVIGDSLTAAGIWQKQLNTILEMNVTTHAKGGMGIVQCVDGENGAGEFDNETAASGILYALRVEDVVDKDLVVFFAGYNNRGTLDGTVGDCYNPNDGSGKTIAGMTQYAINRIYEELAEAGNLTCRVVVITPHCAGKYGYIDADGYEEYPKGSGQTMGTLAKTMEEVALYNSIPCLNLWKTSGINRYTWTVFAANPTATNEDGSGSGTYPYNNDQLHLNNAVGYPYLGKRIANWLQTV